MNPEILTLCEYASEHNGHLTIIDTFDAIVATKFPWRAYFYIAAKVNISDCNINCKTISMEIVSSDRSTKAIFETSSPFDRPQECGKLNLVSGFKGLIFEQAGDYNFRIYLDKSVIADCQFKVILRENE